MDVHVKNELLKTKKIEAFKKIQEMEAQSHKLFGFWKGKDFIFQNSKVPQYDIPDLKDFDLKPYVSFKTPLKLPDELF